ncbi:unnamed protein product [Cladocopium goreaui]|uniref:Uncharacterized protein n=1 Tax=Cladocopium goreaui TaxID=2562237 RepID=A0A9P1BS03_9DINO|nr:unnamed protein product [Cladocopium goreaui]
MSPRVKLLVGHLADLPAALQIHDTDALVENAAWRETGGVVSRPGPRQWTDWWNVVLARSATDSRVDYANVTATVNEVSVRFSYVDVEPWCQQSSASTTRNMAGMLNGGHRSTKEDNQYFWVYSKSSLAEATTPYIHSIVDVDATVLNPQFVGQERPGPGKFPIFRLQDLDLNDLGGFVRWTPNGAPGVQDYLLYLAQSDMGANRAIPNGTAREPFDRFLVYARSSLAEQSTPKALGFVEAAQKFQVMLGFLSHFQDFMVTEIQFDAAFVGFTRRVTAMALLRQRWLAPRGVTPRVAKLRRLARWVKRKGRRPGRPGQEMAMEVMLSQVEHQFFGLCWGAANFEGDVCNANDKVEPVWESGNAAKPAALRPPALSSPVGIPVLHVEHLPVYLGAFCKTSPPLPRNLALWPPAPLQPPPPPPPPPPPVNSLTCPWNMKRLYILDALNLLTHRNQGEENDKSLRWSQLESAAQYYHHGAQVLIFSEWLRGHSLELHRLEMRFGPGCVVSTPAEEGVDSVDTLMLKKAMMERQNGGKAFIVTNNRLEKFKSCADVDLSNLVVKYAMALSTFIPQVEPDVWTQKGSEPDSIPSCGEDFSGYNTSGCILSNLTFSDEDLDLREVANYLTWTSPEVTDSVVDFRIFLAEDGLPAVAQGPMTELGASTVETTEFLVVYSRSSSMTQSTPSAVNVTDLDESVSNVRFEDYDLDPLDIGGGVNWTPPEALEATEFYSVQLEWDQTFEYRSIIAEVAVGEKHYEIPAAPRPLGEKNMVPSGNLG